MTAAFFILFAGLTVCVLAIAMALESVEKSQKQLVALKEEQNELLEDQVEALKDMAQVAIQGANQ